MSTQWRHKVTVREPGDKVEREKGGWHKEGEGETHALFGPS